MGTSVTRGGSMSELSHAATDGLVEQVPVSAGAGATFWFGVGLLLPRLSAIAWTQAGRQYKSAEDLMVRVFGCRCKAGFGRDRARPLARVGDSLAGSLKP